MTNKGEMRSIQTLHMVTQPQARSDLIDHLKNDPALNKQPPHGHYGSSPNELLCTQWLNVETYIVQKRDTNHFSFFCRDNK